MASNVYDIAFRYAVQEKTPAAAQKTENHLRQISRLSGQAAGHMDSLGGALKTAMAAAAGFLVFGQANKHLIGFNAELEDTEIKMAGILSQAMGVNFEEGRRSAAQMVKEFDEVPAFLGSPEQLANAFRGMVEPMSAAGLSLREAKDMTIQLAGAAQTYGEDGADAARQVTMAFMTGGTTRSQFVRSLLKDAGVTVDQFDKIKDRAERARILMRGMDSDRTKAFIAAKQASFTGQKEALIDTIEETLGKVGKPLFTEITKALQSINGWLESNQAKVQQFAKQAGAALVRAFEAAKAAVSFLVEHKDTLLGIAKAWLAIVAVRKVVGVGSAIKDALQTAASLFGTSLTAVGSKFSSLFIKSASLFGVELTKVGKFSAVAMAGAFGFALGTYLNDKFNLSGKIGEKLALLTGRTDEAAVKQKAYDDALVSAGAANQAKFGDTGFGRMRATAATEATALLAGQSKQFEFGDVKNVVNHQMQLAALQGAGVQFEKTFQEALPEDLRETAIQGEAFAKTLQLLQQELKMGTRDILTSDKLGEFAIRAAQIAAQGQNRELKSVEDRKQLQQPAPQYNINSIKIEVESNDPNDIIVGMEDAFRQLEKNPGQARDAFHHG